MANWTTSATSSSFNADSYTQKAANVRKYSFNSGLNGLDGGESFSLLEGLRGNGFKKGYDVVGINASKITTSVIPAFEDYIKNINNKIKEIKVTAAKMNSAFKGSDLQKAVTSYVDKMETYMVNFTTQLRAFEDKLMDVKNAWDKAQQQQAQTISKTGNDFANVNSYTRQINK